MTKIDETLYKKLDALCAKLGKNSGIFFSLFKDGHKAIVEFKDKGGEKQVAYDTVMKLHLKYMDTSEYKKDLSDEWLDCISGIIGFKDLRIWGA